MLEETECRQDINIYYLISYSYSNLKFENISLGTAKRFIQAKSSLSVGLKVGIYLIVKYLEILFVISFLYFLVKHSYFYLRIYLKDAELLNVRCMIYLK